MSTFEAREFSRVFALDREKADRALRGLVASGHVERVGRGAYVVADPSGDPIAEPFFLGSRLVSPSYVSFWSALHLYGWTEQVPRQALFATTKRSRRARVGPFPLRFVQLAPARFFGYRQHRQGSRAFPVAEPEKAIVDSMCLPQYAGGVAEVRAALAEALPGLRVPLLLEYAAKIGSRSLCSRLGLLLDRAGVPADGLRPSSSRTFVKLDPDGPRRGRYDARWRVIDNLREVE